MCALHQERQVVGMSLEISLSKKEKKKKGDKAAYHDLSQSSQKVGGLCTRYDLLMSLLIFLEELWGQDNPSILASLLCACACIFFHYPPLFEEFFFPLSLFCAWQMGVRE